MVMGGREVIPAVRQAGQSVGWAKRSVPTLFL